MASFGFMDAFYTYQFIKRLVKPIEKWEAFKTGVLDKDGNILVPEDKRNEKQKDSFKYFDLLVLNIKKTLSKIPGGSTKIANYAAALWLLREFKENQSLKNIQLNENFDFFIKEEIANSANPINIAGLDNPPKFMGHRVFDVNRGTLNKLRTRKSKLVLDEEENSKEIIKYCKENPEEGVILRNNGEMMFLRRNMNGR